MADLPSGLPSTQMSAIPESFAIQSSYDQTGPEHLTHRSTYRSNHRWQLCFSRELLFMFCCLFCITSHAGSTLLIVGVEDELAENIRLQIDEPPANESSRAFRRYLDAIPEQVVSAMSAFGYYSPTVDVSVSELDVPRERNAAGQIVERLGGGENADNGSSNIGSPDEKSTNQPAEKIIQIRIEVTPNDPVRIRSTDIQINTLESDNPDFAAISKQVSERLAEGKIFVSAEYESAKASILSVAQTIGYFDFEYTQTQVRVSRRNNTADISIVASSGERFSFAGVLFKQQTFSKTFMQRWVPFVEGDPFEASLIGELTQNLQNSGYFSSVRVRPLLDPRYGQTVPIVVDLKQREQNQVGLGIGYSSDTDLRGKLTWGKPLINSHGHSAEAGLSLSRDQQSASFAYRVPRSKEPLYNYWSAEYGLRNENDGDFNSFLSTLNFQRVRRSSRNWTESLFVRWERETFDTGGVEQSTDLVLPGFSYSRSRSKGEPFPTWGQSTSLQLMGGSTRFLSTIDFLKVVGRFRYLNEFAEKSTFIGTIQYGVIQAHDSAREDNYERVPASQRFFAGGDRTIRGFAFRDVSPRNDEGIAVGGRYLEVINLEYNYRFRDRWSAALFTDAGRAFDTFDTGYSVGAGFGVRWQSPVGPFRIDIATPISDNDGNDVRVHLSLGPDL